MQKLSKYRIRKDFEKNPMCIFSLNYNFHRIFHSNKKSQVLHFQSLLEKAILDSLGVQLSRICIFMSSWVILRCTKI